MLKRKWRQILAAKTLLGLGDQASLLEIRQAYRQLSKEHHPDRAPEGEMTRMQEVNAAYALLLEYGNSFRLPLLPPAEPSAALEAEDWWLDRFGEDPLWGRKREG